MKTPRKPEYPPLLPAGFHPKTLSELRRVCVADFPLSETRAKIMTGLEDVVARLAGGRCPGDLWIDGSFLTQDINPADVDLLLLAPGNFYDDGPPEQRQLIEWFSLEDLKASHLCDSHLCFQYPQDHPLYWRWEEKREEWQVRYGFDRSKKVPKGIAMIDLRSGVI